MSSHSITFSKLKDPQLIWTPHQRHEASFPSVNVLFPIRSENYKEFYYCLLFVFTDTTVAVALPVSERLNCKHSYSEAELHLGRLESKLPKDAERRDEAVL